MGITIKWTNKEILGWNIEYSVQKEEKKLFNPYDENSIFIMNERDISSFQYIPDKIKLQLHLYDYIHLKRLSDIGICPIPKNDIKNVASLSDEEWEKYYKGIIKEKFPITIDNTIMVIKGAIQKLQRYKVISEKETQLEVPETDPTIRDKLSWHNVPKGEPTSKKKIKLHITVKIQFEKTKYTQSIPTQIWRDIYLMVKVEPKDVEKAILNVPLYIIFVYSINNKLNPVNYILSVITFLNGNTQKKVLKGKPTLKVENKQSVAQQVLLDYFMSNYNLQVLTESTSPYDLFIFDSMEFGRVHIYKVEDNYTVKFENADLLVID